MWGDKDPFSAPFKYWSSSSWRCHFATPSAPLCVLRVFVCCATPLSHVRCLCAFWNTFFFLPPLVHVACCFSLPPTIGYLIQKFWGKKTGGSHAAGRLTWCFVYSSSRVKVTLFSSPEFTAPRLRVSISWRDCLFPLMWEKKIDLQPYRNVDFAFTRTAPLFDLLSDPDLNGFVFTLCTPSRTLAHLHVHFENASNPHPPLSVSLDYFLFCQCCITKEAVKAHHLLVSQCLSCSAPLAPLAIRRVRGLQEHRSASESSLGLALECKTLGKSSIHAPRVIWQGSFWADVW